MSFSGFLSLPGAASQKGFPGQPYAQLFLAFAASYAELLGLTGGAGGPWRL